MSRRAGRAPCMAALLALVACGDPDGEPLPSEPEQPEGFRRVVVVDDLDHAWGMAFTPSGDILVTERPGDLRIMRGGELLPDPVEGVPEVATGGHGGLLDVALHPDFAANALVYLSYAKEEGGERTTAVARGRLVDDRLEDVEEIFVAEAWSGADQHFGSRLAFDEAGFLYVSIGERTDMDEAQDLTNHQGKIVRLRDDGTVPDDNPFVGEADALPEIWAYGLRNVQGMAFHPGTGALWASDHGPLEGDEINVIRAGRNYGWPEITYGRDYDGSIISEDAAREGMEQPVHHWEEDAPATSGLAVYEGDAFPEWVGSVFVAGLAGERLTRLEVSGEQVVAEEVLLTSLHERIRDVTVGPDGFLYLLLDTDGPMLRLEPADGS